MTASKHASHSSLGSDLWKVAAHPIDPAEYEELPELTEDMLNRGVVNRGGRPPSANPKRLISIRLPEHVIEKWRASGPGWQTRMAEQLARVAPR